MDKIARQKIERLKQENRELKARIEQLEWGLEHHYHFFGGHSSGLPTAGRGGR